MDPAAPGGEGEALDPAGAIDLFVGQLDAEDGRASPPLSRNGVIAFPAGMGRGWGLLSPEHPPADPAADPGPWRELRGCVDRLGELVRADTAAGGDETHGREAAAAPDERRARREAVGSGGGRR